MSNRINYHSTSTRVHFEGSAVNMVVQRDVLASETPTTYEFAFASCAV